MKTYSIIEYLNRTSTGMFFDYSKDVHHLSIEHPTNISKYLQQTPNLTSVAFKFERTAFKPKKFSHTAVVNEVLGQTKLTRLIINASGQNIVLAENIVNHPLEYLEIRNAHLIENLELIHQLKRLQQLVISGSSYSMGENFPNLPELKGLQIIGDDVNFLGLEKCTELQEVQLENNNINQFPKNFLKLPNLLKLTVANCKNVTALPELGAPKLQELVFSNFPLVKEIKTNFKEIPKLELLKLQGIGDQSSEVIFPNSLISCGSLQQLTLASIAIKEIPPSLNKLKELEVLQLYSVSITEFPDSDEINVSLAELVLSGCNYLQCVENIEKLTNLNTLSISDVNAITEITFNFKALPKLQNVNFKNLKQLKTIDETLANVTALVKVELLELPKLEKLPSFGVQNQNITDLYLSGFNNIAGIPTSYTSLKSLKTLHLVSDNIVTLPATIDDLTGLQNLRFNGCENAYLPPAIASLNLSRIFFNVNAKNSRLIASHNVNNTVRALSDLQEKKAILYWTGNGFNHLPITTDIKLNTLKALHHSLKDVGLYILQQIPHFNSDTKINFHQLKSKGKVWVNGAMTGKAALKAKLKELGFTVVNKFSEDVKMIIVGLKPSIPENLFENDVYFTNQLEIEKLAVKENPGLLQTNTVSDEIIKNLQHLLWSADPQNEVIALEMVKAHGLPEQLEEDFILTSKTSVDKNVRSRVKNFLKGKINLQKQKALSVISGAHFKFSYLHSILTATSMARIYYSQFKKEGTCAFPFFRFDDGTHPNRGEVFKAYYPTLISNHKYIGDFAKLLGVEWNAVLSNPVFVGNLHRVRINLSLCKSIPQALTTHSNTLKTIEITIGDNFDVSSIYPFYKLTTLRIDANNTKVEIPEGISALSRLRDFRVNCKEKVDLPEDFKALTKLKN